MTPSTPAALPALPSTPPPAPVFGQTPGQKPGSKTPSAGLGQSWLNTAAATSGQTTNKQLIGQ